MTEREKMLKGLLYDANHDPELIKQRLACKDLCSEYNQLKNSDLEARNNLIRRIIRAAKENIYIEPSFWCDYGYMKWEKIFMLIIIS